MNKYEDHWRDKWNDPDVHKDFLKEEVKSDMWEKIQSSKKDFEHNWQEKADRLEAWKGSLDIQAKQEIWDKLQIPLAKFEKQWRKKINEADDVKGLFLDEAGKERIETSVFAEKENFELEWEAKMNDPVLGARDILDTRQKEKIWNNIQPVIATADQPKKEKRRPFFSLRWSHAAALLIGAFSTWLIWKNTNAPLQNTLVVSHESEVAPTNVKPLEVQKEEIPSSQQESAHTGQVVIAKSAKASAKEKMPVPLRESRGLIEPVAGKVSRHVRPVTSTLVLAKTTPVIHTNNTKAIENNTIVVTPEKEIEAAIAKATPAKKVVHISDIRPVEMHSKGTAIYSRAFGEGKGKRNEKSTMTLNSVIKNYK